MKAHIEYNFTYRQAQEFQSSCIYVSSVFNTVGVTSHSAAYKLVGIHMAELALDLAQKMVLETKTVKQRVNNKTALAIRAAVDAGLMTENTSAFTVANDILVEISKPSGEAKEKTSPKKKLKKQLNKLWKA